MKNIIREPLLHFLLLGIVMFGAYGLMSDQSSSSDEQLQEIVVSEGQIDALITGFEKVWQRLPSQQELEGLVQSHIREEVMYREALAMGLDRNDGIIRRRLQQKLEFLTDDIANFEAATNAELEAFLAANQELFRQQSRFSFKQIYFNANERGATALSDATGLLHSLRAEKYESQELANAGDHLLMSRFYFQDVSERDISRELGAAFTDRMKQLVVGSWQGPVDSGFGLHLVYIEAKEIGTVPPIADIRAAVETEWSMQQRTNANEAFYTVLRQGYIVTIEASDERVTEESSNFTTFNSTEKAE